LFFAGHSFLQLFLDLATIAVASLLFQRLEHAKMTLRRTCESLEGRRVVAGGERVKRLTRLLKPSYPSRQAMIEPDDQPWYREWRQALERVIAAQMMLDATKPGTPQRQTADQEYEAAIAAFRAIANQVR
jgi:hypothetical protein